MKFCRDGSVIYKPCEHEEAQRAIACVHELQDLKGKSSKKGEDKVTGFNTNNSEDGDVHV